MGINIPNADTTTLKGVVIPDAFKQPQWVYDAFNEFKASIKKEYSGSKHINSSLVRDAIKNILLDGKISPPYPLHSKNVGTLFDKMYKLYGDSEFQWRYMLIYQAGFFLSTFTSTSFTPESLMLPAQFKKKKAQIVKEYMARQEEANTEQDKDRNIMYIDKAFKDLTEEVLIFFRANPDDYPIIDSIDSGAKGKTDDLRKLIVAVGLSINAKNEINDVIDKSHADALTPTQFFNYTSQAIVSQYKKSSETAIPGYLIRQLNTIMVGVKLSKTIDCNTKGTLPIYILNKDMLKSMQGKLYTEGVIDQKDLHLVGTKIKLRSPLYCKAKDGICHACYNPDFIENMNLHRNAGIGLLASTQAATLLTSMTLKAAHTGLNLDKAEVDLSHDIFEYSE